MNQRENIINIFTEFKESFKNKIDNTYYISIQYEISGIEGTDIVQVKICDGNIQLFFSEEIVVEEIMLMSYETLKKLYNHELTMVTAMSCQTNESSELKFFIEPKFKDEKRIIYLNKENDKDALSFAQRMHKMDDFFNKDNVYIAKVDKKYCGKGHGVDTIGLYFDFEKKILHAYFEINQGDTLQEPAIPFSIFVIQGTGNMMINNENTLIESNTYYHVNPSGDVFISNVKEETLKILYI